MSWFVRLDERGITRELRRIADALERIAPEPEQPEELSPTDAVSYTDENIMAERDLAERLGKVKQWLETRDMEDEPVRHESD